MFTGIWRDLVYASRSLAKARAFTFVCVVSLGIGMAPVIAIPYVSRLTTLTPPGVNTEELVELVTTSVGPHQQTEQWSYPDYVDLRDANTGITLIGWIGAPSEVTFQATGGSKMRTSTMFVPANYFKTLTMDGIPHVVVGVAPDQFGGHIGFTGWDLFVPLERHPRLLARAAADAEQK